MEGIPTMFEFVNNSRSNVHHAFRNCLIPFYALHIARCSLL